MKSVIMWSCHKLVLVIICYRTGYIDACHKPKIYQFPYTSCDKLFIN